MVIATRIWVLGAVGVPRGPDNLGPWAVAFQFAGARPALDMYDLPPYSVGMGAVLAPLVALVQDPVLRHRIAIGLLGLGGLVAAWLTARTVRAALGAPLPAAAAFCVVAGATAVSFGSSFTWVEPLALVWLVAVLTAMCWSLGAAPRWSPVAVAALASTAILVHGRMALVPVVWLGAVVATSWPSLRRPEQRRSGAALVGATAAVTVLGGAACRVLQQAMIDRAWSRTSADTETRVLDALGRADFPVAVLVELAGQAWYLTASTLGLAPLGLGVLTVVAAGRSGRPELDAARWRRSAAVVLVTLLSVWAVGCLFMAGEIRGAPYRADHLVYGRYVDQVAVVLAAIGAAGLVVMTRRTALRAMAREGDSPAIQMPAAAMAVTPAAYNHGLASLSRWARAVRCGAMSARRRANAVSATNSAAPGWWE